MLRAEVPYFDNTIKDIPGRLLEDSMLQDSKNIIFTNRKIRNRYGLQQLSQSLNSKILRILLYKQLYNDATYVVALTATDAYYLDASGNWKYITRCFNHGTVARTAGSANITLTPPTAVNTTIATDGEDANLKYIYVSDLTGIERGMLVTLATDVAANTYVAYTKTDSDGNNIVGLSKQTVSAPTATDAVSFSWNFMNSATAGEFGWDASDCWISFDSSDPNECTTWVQVTGITSGTVITTADTTELTSTSYCIRICYSGDEDDKWSYCFPYDDMMEGGGDKCLMLTNGVNYMQMWQGEQGGSLTYMQDVYAYPNLCKHVGFYGSVGAEHIICCNVYDTGSASWNSTAIEVSDAGEIAWDDGATYPLFDSTDILLGSKPLMTRLMLYKRDSISIAEATYSTDVTNPFSIQQNVIRDLGVCSMDTIYDIGTEHIFFDGERIYRFDGFNHSPVDQAIYKYVGKIINASYINRCFAFAISDLNLYCLAIPAFGSETCNFVVVYNYVDNNFTFWTFKETDNVPMAFAEVGQFINSSNPTWSDEIITATGACAITTGIVTCDSTTGMQVGMRAVPAGYTGENLYISEVTDGTHFTVQIIDDDPDSNESLIPPSNLQTFTAGISSTTWECGFTALQSIERWSDLITVSVTPRTVVCDNDGDIYELSDSYITDSDDTDDYNINSFITTKDFEHNKGQTCIYLGVIFGLARKETDIDDTGTSEYADGTIYVIASSDYGRTWTTEQTLAFQPNGVDYYLEKKIALHLSGKAIRIKARSEGAYDIERIFIEYNPLGISQKYDR